MAICDRHGLPVAVHVASASPYEPHLVPATLDARFLREPRRDYRRPPLRQKHLDTQLRDQYGIEMIAPNRTRRHGPHKMAAPTDATDAARATNASLRGCTTRDASSRAGNITSRTSSAYSNWPAPKSCSGIYEIPSSLIRPTQRDHVRETRARAPRTPRRLASVRRTESRAPHDSAPRPAAHFLE